MQTKNYFSLIKKKLEKEGYDVKHQVRIYDYDVDIIATKDGMKHLIEIKMTQESAISVFAYLKQYTELTEISFVWLALPKSIITGDIITISETVGIGLYSIDHNKMEIISKAKKLPEGNLDVRMGSYSLPVTPGKNFSLNIVLYAVNKNFRNIEVSYLSGEPFYIPKIESIPKIIDVIPQKKSDIKLIIGVRGDTKPDIYSLYVTIKGEKTNLLKRQNIRITEETEHTIINKLTNVRNLLAHSQTNVEDTLKTIGEIIDKQNPDITQIIPKWNELAGYCLTIYHFQQAELIYKKLLEVILKHEQNTNKRLHKGSEYYNLGLSLATQGKMKEAQENWSLAYKEDIINFGKTKALDLPAKKALDKYSK